MSYYSRFYRQRNPHLQDEATKESFFAKQSESKPGQKNAFFQAKLSVNQPSDPSEQQADAVASTVVNQPFRTKQSNIIDRSASSPASGGFLPADISAKIENRSGKGNSLPKNVQQEMGVSFGKDFSNVKTHTDQESVNMSQALQAQAFTHGSDIYFNEGKYNPQSKQGKSLLAHELTHVVQQTKSVQQKQIQRSFWGTLGGIVTGAVGGFLAGGPVGAIVGGVAGGVIGDAATTHTRKLNDNEKHEAQKVFGNSLNYDAVSVSDSSELLQIGGYARTPWNTVYFPTGTLGRSDPAYYTFLIHELTHTWQAQHGVSVLTKIRYSLSESNYNFGGDAGLEKAISEGKCFNEFNTEAQASIMERYYDILTGQKTGDGLLYYHYVDELQNHAGHCAPKGSENDMLDQKYRTGGATTASA